MNRLHPISGAAALTLALLACSGCASGPQTAAASSSDATPLTPQEAQKRRSDILAMRDATLAELYKQNPQAREELEKAIGYAVFDSSQFNIIMLVEAHGRGVLVDNATATPTYMLAARAGTGPGLGYKSFRQILIFKNKTVFDQFRVAGADVSASADATARMTPGVGASAQLATSFNPYITMYEFTDRGVVLQANWGGAAYLPDAQLNGP